MKVSEILKNLDFGKSVAEFDEDLRRYFVDTHIYTELMNGEVDIIGGDKGTGKSALYIQLSNNQRHIKSGSVAVINAFNPTGDPTFRTLVHNPPKEVSTVSVRKVHHQEPYIRELLPTLS